MAMQMTRKNSLNIKLSVVLALLFSTVVLLEAAPGDVLVESRFTRDMDGWFSVTDKKLDSEIQLDLDRGSQRVKGGETGDVSWYYSAPEKFLGDQQKLYHGILKYTLGHFIFDTTQGSPSPTIPDVILESKSKRLKLGALYVFEPGTSAKEYQIPLSASAFQSSCKSGSNAETCAGDGESCYKDADCCSRQCVGGRARWFNLKQSRPATNAELIKVLSDVTSLQIRGGYYPGGMEKTWLRGPMVIEGSPFNRSDAGGSEGGGEGGAPRKRSDMCEPGESVSVALRPVTESGSFNIPLKRPWTHYFAIPNLPEICTDATLTVLAKGELAGEGTYVGVLGEEANMLGRLFVTAGDFSEDSQACKGEENCKAGPARGGNQSVYMAEEVVASASVLEDSLVISRGRMVQYAADGTLKVGLFVEGDSVVPEVTVVGMRLSFRLGGCYSKRLLGFPGLSRKPDRYSGFVTTLALHDPPAPDDAAAILVNATSNLDPAANELVVAFNALASPGTFGPEFRLEGPGAGGSRSKIEVTGQEWDLAVAGRFFTKSYNDGRTLEPTTRIEAEVVPRSTLAAGVGEGAGGTVQLAVLLQANGEGGGQPDLVKLNELKIVYPPASCLVHTLKVGAGVEGLGDGGMIREVEYCAETWECDSNSADVNGRRFEMEEDCRSVCFNARQVGGGIVTPGTCFQPQLNEGTCATAGALCGCTRQGKAECSLSGVVAPADGDCRCRVASACTRTPQNVSYPFVFQTPVSKPPLGDVTLFVTAMLPHPLSSDHWLRIRLAERDMKILGYVFASPDCSHDCTEPWTDRDPMYSVTSSIRIDHETAALAMADGDFQFRIEIDEPRLAISCALHPESYRCGGNFQPTQRFRQNAGFSELVGAITDTDTNVTLRSVANTGITQNLFGCPNGVCAPVYIRIEDELLEVTALAGNSLTVERGVGGSIAAPHAVGACTCSGNATVAACFSAGSAVACAVNGGTWTVSPVTFVDPLILPPLANYGDIVLRSLTLSYATASE